VLDDGAAIQKNLDRLEAGVSLTKFNRNKFEALLLGRKNLLQQQRLEAALV